MKPKSKKSHKETVKASSVIPEPAPEVIQEPEAEPESEKPKYQLMPDLTDEEYQALKADIQKYGLQYPIEKDDKGNILVGHFREKICQELGLPIPDEKIIVHKGLSEKEKIQLIYRNELLRRHLHASDHQKAIEKLRKQGLSIRAISESLGVSKSSVARQVLEAPVPNGTTETKNLQIVTTETEPKVISPEITQTQITGKDGKKYPATRKDSIKSDGTSKRPNAEIEKQNALALKPKSGASNQLGSFIDTLFQLKVLTSYHSGEECFRYFNELVNTSESANIKSDWQAVCEFVPTLAKWFTEFAVAIHEGHAESEPESGNSEDAVN